VISSVVTQATRVAAMREAPRVMTTDVLVAVMDLYGDTFVRVLTAHGGDVDEVTARVRA
jgi:hypothetical protein